MGRRSTRRVVLAILPSTILTCLVQLFTDSSQATRGPGTCARPWGLAIPSRERFCDECVAGMEWVEAYLEDPIFQAEALLYLEHNWCDPHHHGEHCIETLQRHFIPMHVMVMEKYMI